MEKRLDRLEEKFDKMMDAQAAMNATLAAQHVTLKEHMRRSKANEEAVELLGNRLTPIQEHVIRVKGVGKFLAFVVTILGGIGTMFGIASFFKV